MKIKYIVTLTLAAFLLHIIWENVQAPLYMEYKSFWQNFPICFVGTLGDVVITLLVFVLVWLFKRDIPNAGTDFLALAIIGFVVAVAIEQNALLLDKWDYTATMPLVPYVQVGLTPILQMTILLPLSFYLARLFNQRLYEKL